MKKYTGAEAEVILKGEKAVKKRKPKEYRHPEIDHRMRRQRTKRELENIRRARKYNVDTPEPTVINETSFKTKRIEAKPLKDVINENTGLMMDYGRNVAKIHEAKIIHGDLTTSNALAGKKIWVIDFGLSYSSKKTEDRAVDIHLLKQVLNSSHPEIAEQSWEEFKNGYKEFQSSEKVLKQLEKVEKRGRYK